MKQPEWELLYLPSSHQYLFSYLLQSVSPATEGTWKGPLRHGSEINMDYCLYPINSELSYIPIQPPRSDADQIYSHLIIPILTDAFLIPPNSTSFFLAFIPWIGLSFWIQSSIARPKIKDHTWYILFSNISPMAKLVDPGTNTWDRAIDRSIPYSILTVAVVPSRLWAYFWRNGLASVYSWIVRLERWERATSSNWRE